jgi:hypothetical protein
MPTYHFEVNIIWYSGKVQVLDDSSLSSHVFCIHQIGSHLEKEKYI